MKALSIRQPWAWLIVNGYKAVENRDWNTNFRGEFLIHASKGMTRMEYDSCQGFCWRGLEPTKQVTLPPFEDMERGGIVGIASLVNVVHEREKHLLTECDKPWFFGEYGFILDNVRPLPFMPLKGALGFFNVNYEGEL